jgi:hypothetical protein
MSNTSLNNYILDKNNYSFLNMRARANPAMSWAVPYVTGKKYKIHWGYGNDWT